MGKDISCNLGSLNIATAMDLTDFGKTIETSIRALTAVSDMSHISSVPSVEKGNDDSHAIGLGQMNLHGYLARERIHYGSDEGVDFTNIYFYTVTYHAMRASNRSGRRTRCELQGLRELEICLGRIFRQVYRAGMEAGDREGAGTVRRLPASISRRRKTGWS